MIITCPYCDKKFNVDASLIPNEGRTLQCGFCDEKWHFKLNNKNCYAILQNKIGYLYFNNINNRHILIQFRSA